MRDLGQRFGGRFARVASFLVSGNIGDPSPEKQDRDGGGQNQRGEQPYALLRFVLNRRKACQPTPRSQLCAYRSAGEN